MFREGEAGMQDLVRTKPRQKLPQGRLLGVIGLQCS